jgi:cytochrome c oxidase subunit 1
VAVALKRRGVPRNAGERVFASLAAVSFLEAAGFGQFLRLMGADIHLYDTYFVVGLFHLRVTTCLVAALAVAFRHSPRDGQKILTSVAAVLSILGSQIMGFAMLVVGTRGMPRRYYNYLPEFEPWHRAIAVGGCLLILGIVFALFDILKSRSTPPSPEEAHGAGATPKQSS